MREAVLPFGTLTGSGCHNLIFELNGPWANYALPDGTKANGELTWSVLKVNVLRLFVDLADLDEDKVQNQSLFSLDYISKHVKGTRYEPDSPAVLLFTKGLNSKLVVHTVDLDKVATQQSRSKTESGMGVTLDERKFAILLFSDQEHADVFSKALQKAIVVCKSEE